MVIISQLFDSHLPFTVWVHSKHNYRSNNYRSLPHCIICRSTMFIRV